MSEYSSERGTILDAFVKYRIATNRWSSVPAKNFLYFDRYCFREFSGIPGLEQRMMDGWCEQRKVENKRSRISKCYPVIELVKYLIDPGNPGNHSLRIPEMPPAPKGNHIPLAFSEDELFAFFYECDKRV